MSAHGYRNAISTSKRMKIMAITKNLIEMRLWEASTMGTPLS